MRERAQVFPNEEQVHDLAVVLDQRAPSRSAVLLEPRGIGSVNP